MTLWQTIDNRLFHFGLPLAIFLGILVVGIIVDRWAISRVRRYTRRTRWVGGDRVISALSGMLSFVGASFGARTAITFAPLSVTYLGYIKQVVDTGSILIVTWMVERLVSAVIDTYSAKENSTFPTTTIFINIIKVTIYTLGALMALHSVGISIAPLVTALGIGGLAVALALKDTLSNLFAGIQVIVSKQLAIGDYVSLGKDQEGHIVDITWRNTTIRSLSNSTVIVPNSTVSTGVITNFGRSRKEFSFPVPIQVDYTSDLERVERLIRDVILSLQADFSSKMPKVDPGVKFAEFGESGIKVNASLRVYEFDDQFEIRHEFIKRMHAVILKEGIHIPFPTREILHKMDGGAASL